MFSKTALMDKGSTCLMNASYFEVVQKPVVNVEFRTNVTFSSNTHWLCAKAQTKSCHLLNSYFQETQEK